MILKKVVHIENNTFYFVTNNGKVFKAETNIGHIFNDLGFIDEKITVKNNVMTIGESVIINCYNCSIVRNKAVLYDLLLEN